MRRDERGGVRGSVIPTVERSTRGEAQPGRSSLTEQHAADVTPPMFEQGGEWEKIPTDETAGADATFRVEFPYRSDTSGKVNLPTWWVGQSAFTKGSPFNP